MNIECVLGILERVRGLEAQKKSLQLQQSKLDLEINMQKKKVNEFLDDHFMDVKSK
ncbi:MAG: hypothetical protein O6761_00345 [Thaumarchaeota archaeon]|nr:hypothetical protein [Nitrososphaerota archaeon]